MSDITVTLTETTITAAVANPADITASIASAPITASVVNGNSITGTIASTPVTATLVNGGTVTVTITETPVTATLSSSAGDVAGPSSAVNNNFASYNGTTGKLIKDSGSAAASFELADATIVKTGNASWIDLTDGGATILHTHAGGHDAVTIGTANGLSLVGQALSLGLASAGVTGALSGTDWSTFSAKIGANDVIDGGIWA